MRILRVLRGIVKTALTWAVLWVPVSLIPFGLATLFGGHLPAEVLVPLMISHAIIGAINGGVFATVLAVAGRGKTFETLSLSWIAACGAVGGALVPFGGRAVMHASFGLPIPASVLAWTLVTNAVLGAGCAAITLSLARRAPALPTDGAARPVLDAGMA